MADARELTVDVPAAHGPAAIAAVHAVGVMGVQVRDRGSGAPRGRVHVIAWLPPTDATAALAEALAAALTAAAGPSARVTWRDVPVTWDAGPPSRDVGARFAVVAPGAHAPPGRTPLVLEAALAFGDGLHPTTALCVEALEARLGGGAGAISVLDVGTGTGILALVAERLGAAPVVAHDIDPLAVWAARRTMAANAARVDVVEALPDTAFDLVVANLYLAPLRALLPTLAARVAPAAGGALLVSGFRADALADVAARAEHAGLTTGAPVERDGWCALLAQRPN